MGDEQSALPTGLPPPVKRTLVRALAGASVGASVGFTLLVSSGLFDLSYSPRNEARLSAVYAWLALLTFWFSRQCSFTPGRDLLWLLFQFRRTLVVAAGAGVVLFLFRESLLLWFTRLAFADATFSTIDGRALSLPPAGRVFHGTPAALQLAQLRVALTCLGVVVAPLAAAEFWSLLARAANSERARRLTVAFGVATGGAAMLAAFVCVRLAPLAFYELLGFAGS